ncbi:Fur family transcriptional regulator [Clostridium frigidicarnis]|uniref:Fe2+ or Zn2+ uptake regulation protein n=1 Tax=Clostridium frigidicarnis TaxID=84698 RepID=A0A1I0WYC8_9CLOT|nr:Fur family transcriptional regulator [Clostridium frigidicarnis]SFA93407.1 Fe2+ or Zn2+ uptake regulation protein [Clostridium frigidicarnis]
MQAIKVFNEHNIKLTKARISIYNIIMEEHDAITAEDVYKKCLENGLNINLSTVYRTLDLFEDKSIVEKYDLGKGCYNFSIQKNDHKHVLQCSICHKEIELNCPMKQIEAMVKSETGFVLLEHELKMKGLCKDCSDEK